MTTDTTTTNEEIILGGQFCDELFHLWKREDAEAEDVLINKNDAEFRIRFFCFIGRRGHRALGLTFDEYCARFGMSHDSGTRRLKSVRASMEDLGISDQQLLAMLHTGHFPIRLMTGQVAETLFKLDTPAERASAIERYRALPLPELCSHGQPLQAANIGQLKFCVKHILDQKSTQLAYFSEQSSTDLPPAPPAITQPPQVPVSPTSVILSRDATLSTPPEILPPANPPRHEHKPFVAPPQPQESAQSPTVLDSDDVSDIPEYPCTGLEWCEERGGYVAFGIGADGWDVSLFIPMAMYQAAAR